MEIGGVPNIRWKEGRGPILESQPSLRTSGYTMNLLYIPPNKEHTLKGGEFVIALLRGSVIGKYHLPVQKSLLFMGDFTFKSGGNGCLLFVCQDEGDNHKYFDDTSGLEVEWITRPTMMYASRPFIFVDDYLIALNYIAPGNSSGIHDHSIHMPQVQGAFGVEFHMQLRGNGWMREFEDKEGTREVSRVAMLKGFTHDLFCFVKDKAVIYPWHDYIAGVNGALFILFIDQRVTK
ncbi:hypothetical protein ACFLWO_04500 [Chloroflexota bacterium]